MTGFVCGGDPTPGDLAIVQEFAAALALPTKHLQFLALLEMGDSDEERAALAAHTLDPEPWANAAPDFERYADPSDNPGRHGSVFDPRPPHCNHRECYS